MGRSVPVRIRTSRPHAGLSERQSRVPNRSYESVGDSMAPRRGGDRSAPLRGRPFPCIVPPCTYSSHVKGGVLEVERTKSGKVRRVPLPPALAAEIRTRVARLVPFVHHGQFAQTVKRLSGVV